MRTRRATLELLAASGVLSLAGCSGEDNSGDGGIETTDSDGNGTIETGGGTASFTVRSSAFDDTGTIPTQYTADGADVSPPLSVGTLPEEAETWALIVDDPDAPGGTFVHWLLWNVPARTTELPEDVPTTGTVADLGGARQGTNGFGETGYRGPAPPSGDDPHTYRFTAYAVDSTLALEAGAERDALDDALSGATLEAARITGEYGR